jgi:hypothetical protein
VAVPVVGTILVPVMLACGVAFVLAEMLPLVLPGLLAFVMPDVLARPHVLGGGIPRLRHRALVPGWNVLRKRRHGLVVNNLLQVHPQLFHFRETFGRNVISALALLLFFVHPPQFLGGFDEDPSQSKGIHRADAGFFRVFGFHLTPSQGCGTACFPSFLVFGNLEVNRIRLEKSAQQE